MDTRQYGRMSYLERTTEHPRTQEIAEVAHFHGHDGLIVPSARSDASNLIVFCARVDPDQVEAVRDHGIVDWNSLP
jgi:hypothetical protein